MRTYVVGTAGHVDHGKSTLVKSLTGIDPDRLREEKERQLTIDLGFAWTTLPGEVNIGIVDVPGHRDFIENMLAGVGGIDAALFVVAADEGMMPQSQEHLEILDLLEVDRGLVALTKTDLVEVEWLELVEGEIRAALAGTSLQAAPILRVSSKDGSGLEQLADGLSSILTDTERAPDKGRARMPVDRAFTLKGYGTIVTGTLLDGHLEQGQDVYVMPGELEGRVRGLQTHKQDVKVAVPGSRVAVNISGVDVNDIERGDVLVADTSDRPTTLIDAKLRILDSSPALVAHNQEVKLFVGADQKIARVRVLGGKEHLAPGESGWVQLMVREPLVVRRGDRFVLRRPSPPLTLGGGRIVDPHPPHRYRLGDHSVIEKLERRLEGGQAQIIVSALAQLGPAQLDAIAYKVNIQPSSAADQLQVLQEQGEVEALTTATVGKRFYVRRQDFDRLGAEISKTLRDFHNSFPLRSGMPAQELRGKVDLDQEIFSAFIQKLTDSELIKKDGPVVRLPDFTSSLNDQQSAAVEKFMAEFEQSPYAPPSVKETRQALSDELYAFLLGQGRLVEVSEDVVFRQEDFRTMVREIQSMIEASGRITVAQVRDHFDTSRKFVLGLLEYLDRQGITVREGDFRRLAGRS